MPAKAPSDATIAFADRLRAFLDQPWPPAHIDRPAHDLRLAELQRLILQLGGAFGQGSAGYMIRLDGLKATSTVNLASACGNWVTQVTLKAGQAAMARGSA